jgi:predicted ester cyclase
MTETTDPVALIERLYEAMNTGDPRLIDDVATNVLAPGWANEPTAHGQVPGADGFRTFVPRLRDIWPDFTISHDEIVVSADGSRVAVRSTGRVTHSTGEFLGLPATGRVGELHAFDLHHIADGRIQRSFHLEDFLGLLRQFDAKITPGA